MATGVQFTGKLDPGQHKEWFTHGWDRDVCVSWSVRPRPGHRGKVALRALTIEAGTDDTLTYRLTVWNVGSDPIQFDAVYSFTR